MTGEGRTHRVELTDRDLRLLGRALRPYRQKLRSRMVKDNFIPEPGRANVTENNLKHAEELLERFAHLLGYDLELSDR